MRNEIYLLIDRADAEQLCFLRSSWIDGLAFERSLTGISLVNSRKNFDESRFAGAILAHQACTSPRRKVKLTSESALTPGKLLLIPLSWSKRFSVECAI